MAAPYNFILSKAEKAVVSWLGTRSIGTSNIYAGRRSAGKSAPCVIVHAHKAVEYPKGSGNYHVDLAIMVRTNAADASNTDAHDTLVGKTFDSMKVTDTTNPNYLAEQISSQVTDFTVYNINDTGGEDLESGVGEDESDFWTDQMNMKLYCAGADI